MGALEPIQVYRVTREIKPFVHAQLRIPGIPQNSFYIPRAYSRVSSDRVEELSALDFDTQIDYLRREEAITEVWVPALLLEATLISKRSLETAIQNAKDAQRELRDAQEGFETTLENLYTALESQPEQLD